MNILRQEIKSSAARSQRGQMLLLTAAGTAILTALSINSASAEEANAPALLLPDIAPISDAELQENRGGFSVGNVNISFGFTVSIAVQGPTVNPIQVTQTFNVDTPGHLTAQIDDAVNKTLSDVGIATKVGDSKSDSADAPAPAQANTVAPTTAVTQPTTEATSSVPQNTGAGDQVVAQNSVPQANSTGAPTSTPTSTVALPAQGANDSGTQPTSTVPAGGGVPTDKVVNDVVATPPTPTPTPTPTTTPTTQSAATDTPTSGSSHQSAQDAPPLPPPQPVSTAADTKPTTQSTQSADAPPDVPDNGKASFTAHLDTKDNSISLTNNQGTNIHFSTQHGILTTVSNTVSDVSVQTEVDLNYTIQNYHSIKDNVQSFQQAMSLAQQMLAIHGIGGH